MDRFRTFTMLVAKASRSIRRIKTEEMAEYNLKAPHVSCLYYLYKEETLTAKELCDVCDEDKASISRSIDHLEKCGYLHCDSTAAKRYKAPLALTASGRELAEKIVQKIDGVLDFVGAGLSDEERHAFYHGLELINNKLDEFCEKYE